MPRKPRAEHEGAIYHVFARGVNRCRIFVDDEDYHRYLRLLGETVKRQGWNVLAYCLMPNHVHHLIETPNANLGDGIQLLHGLYAQRFNERHHRVGHLFQDRHRAEHVTDERYLATLASYVAMNPVAAVLCHRTEDWPWSSHATIAAGEPPAWLAHSRLIELLGDESVYTRTIEERWALTLDPTLK